ncbi:MAG TPA: hypothetical protein VKA92_11475 [Segetibacter sp.]|nr:hypothetical protein [Segetibacter sp.]
MNKFEADRLITIPHRLLHFFLFILIAALPTQLSAQNADETAIRKLLEDQTIAWNKGSIEDFMKGYWQNDSLMFIGKNGVKYGYETTLENYQKNYPDTIGRGKLYFDLFQVKKLSKEYYYVTGKWQLIRSIGDLEGHFTLLFRKIKKNWVIVSDHSS